MLLTFDTSLDKTYIGLADYNKILDTKIIKNEGSIYHSTFLISSITEILKNNNLTPNDLDLIATNVGPGSFTGIRACMTTAKIMAQQLNIKIAGVSSLDILSKIKKSEKKILVLLDARKNKAYVWNEKILGAIELEEVKKIIETGKYTIICDDSMYKTFSNITDDITSYTTTNCNLAETLINIVNKNRKNISKNWNEIKPLYIQPPPIFGK